MNLRAAMFAGLVFLGIVLPCIWLLAPAVFTEARREMDGQRPEMLVARAAGAADGHPGGTVRIVIGAELGRCRACCQHGAQLA